MTYCGICGRPESEVKIHKSSGPDICFSCRKDRNLQREHGLSLDEYTVIFDKQGGVCAICGGPPSKKMLVVDHCHKTGKIRGLLCNQCNLNLGGFKDSISNLASAIKYLEKS
jgi:hypothetical protein